MFVFFMIYILSYYRRRRYAGYRATVYFLYGKLGKNNVVEIPSCVGEF